MFIHYVHELGKKKYDYFILNKFYDLNITIFCFSLSNGHNFKIVLNKETFGFLTQHIVFLSRLLFKTATKCKTMLVWTFQLTEL